VAGCGGGEPPANEEPTPASTVSGGPDSTVGLPPTAPPASPAEPAAPIPRVVTPADDGRIFTMRVDEVAALVVADPDAPDPVVDGRSVLVIPIVNIQASGRREWELRAVARGRTVIRAGGATPYSITLEVY
jgi:hypothetical protein